MSKLVSQKNQLVKTRLGDIVDQDSFLEVVIHADDVRPQERRRDNEHDGNGDDPESRGKFVQPRG